MFLSTDKIETMSYLPCFRLENMCDLVTTVRFLSSYAKERRSRLKIFEKLADDPKRSKYIKFPSNDATKLIIADPDCPG